jgi:prepilin peptidase CpaA
LNPILFTLVLIQLLAVSWIDIKIKKISNRWFLFNTLLALVCYLFLKDDYVLKWSVLIFPLSIIVIGFLLFLVEIMGAGDSKYLASLFLITPPSLHMLLLEKIIYSTATVGFIFLGVKFLRDFQKIKAYAFITYWKGLKEIIRSRFSYAPVILLAWILLGMQQWL